MLRQYSYAAAGQAAAVVFAVIALAVITRVLGPADYGTYVVLMTTVVLLSIIVSAGPQAAALVIAAREPDRRASLHGQILVASLALGAITLVGTAVLAAPLARALAPSVDPAVVVINIIRLPAVVYASLITSQLSGAGRIGTAATLTVTSAAVALLAPAGALLAPDPLLGAVIGTAAGSLVSAAIAGSLATSAFGLARPAGMDIWRGAAAIAVPMHIGTVAYWLMLRLDVIVVSAMLGRFDAGTYGLALGVSERVGLLTAPLYNATAWRISGPNRADALATMLRVARLELAVGAVLAVSLIVASPLVVWLLSGERFGAATLPLAILVLGAAGLPVWAAVGLFLVSHLGGVWTTAKLQVAVAILSVAGYVVATRLAGVVGAASVSTGSYLVLLSAGLLLIRRSEPFRWRDLLPGPELLRVRGYLAALTRRDADRTAD